MHLVYDISGSRKPLSYKADISDSFNWPHIVHISWIILNQDLKPIEDKNYLIQPIKFSLTDKQAEVIHIEKQELQEKGNKIEDVLQDLKKSSEKVKYVFAHNLKLNGHILGAECYRNDMNNFLAHIESYCLMEEGTFYCKLPGKRGYKWPSLLQLHTALFKKGYTPTGNARADTIAAARCFIGLKKAGALDDIFFD